MCPSALNMVLLHPLQNSKTYLIGSPLDLLTVFDYLLAAFYVYYMPGEDVHISLLSAVVLYYDAWTQLSYKISALTKKSPSG